MKFTIFAESVYKLTMKKFLLLLTAGGLLLAVACNKKEDDPAKPDIAGKTNRQIFMMQPWHFNYWADSAENDTKWDDQMDPCMKDDIFTFNSNTKYNVKEGSVKCYPNDYDANWSMTSDNATVVTLIGFDWEIKSKANEQLVLWRIQNGSEQHFQKLILTRD